MTAFFPDTIPVTIKNEKDHSGMRNLTVACGAIALTLATTSVALADDNTGGRYLFLLPGAAQASAAAPAATAPVRRATARAERFVSRQPALRGAPSGAIKALIAQHAAANGVPYALADAVVRIESRYQPHVSNGGALGLMQIKPQTARGEGFSGPASALYHPSTNIAYGMKYLARAYRMSGGDTCGTVMRYQSGHAARGMNAANRAYCAKARAIMARA